MFTQKDLKILRNLGEEKARIAQLPVQKENQKLWTDINDLKGTKAPIFIAQMPWNEMNVDDELTLKCEDSFCRQIEDQLRKELYCWKYIPGNRVIDNVMKARLFINDSGFGIEEKSELIKIDESSDVPSRHFEIQISKEEDIEKIKEPIISLDHEKTEENYQKLKHIFDGILDVQKWGVQGYWFTPWDNLIRYTGVTEGMMDLILQPDYINALVSRWVDVSMIMLEKYVELGVWASNNNACVGSGGPGYCSDLEPAEKYKTNAPLTQLWGCGNAQIFSEVSPEMHWEFSLKHEMRWLERFGLTYYGCCEPLDFKMDILKKIPNLRKISASPWVDMDRMMKNAGDDYVISIKPSPAVFAGSHWDPVYEKEEIKNVLQKTQGASVEFIMKDITTVGYKPQRLWEWAKITQEAVDEFFG